MSLSESEDGDDTNQVDFLKQSIFNYLKLDTEIKALEKGIKQRKNKKDKLGESIMSFLQEQDISHVNLHGDLEGKQMALFTSNTKSGITAKKIESSINDFFKDDIEKGEQLLDNIMKHQKSKECNKLKIAKPTRKQQLQQLEEQLVTEFDENEDADSEITDNNGNTS
jgi:hypothetical protein